jgi:hypothetical protein
MKVVLGVVGGNNINILIINLIIIKSLKVIFEASVSIETL